MNTIVAVVTITVIAGLVFLVLWVIYRFGPLYRKMSFRKFLHEISIQT